ncbi:MAG: EAL domain-containing protein [Clostridia bacterium]|nr:EAL domain-containing protein [Clostridia bacterium]
MLLNNMELTAKTKCRQQSKRIAVLLLCVAAVTVMALPLPAYAQEAGKTVRVGWYESPFNSTDSNGRRSGYAYEYQRKIAAYTGWEYTYVSGSWPDLMQMLEDGEIDLMSDVSYTEERAQNMLFSGYSMGTEEYCVFITPDNRTVTPEDASTLNGKRIGVNKGSVQEALFLKWAEAHGVQSELVELTSTETDSVDMLEAGKLDAYVTLNAYGDPRRLRPVCKIGSSDFYFAVSKARPDLLDELNAAMSQIQDANPYYNQRMFERHMQSFGTNAFLTEAERSWLADHGAVRVGYQDNYLAFCARNPETGELTGMLKDYLSYAADCMANAHIDFEAVDYPTAAAALEAMNRGEVDCVFPANLSSYDGEVMDIVMTPPMMRTDMYAVVRRADESVFANRDHVIVAVNEGNPNYTAFLQDSYPGWRAVYFANTADCLKAVSVGVADCVLISGYRYNNISRLCEKYDLAAFATGVGMDYCFAVNGGQTELYAILAKAIGMVPNSTVNAAISRYLAEDAQRTFTDFILDNLALVIGAVAAVMLLIVLLMLRSVRAERRAKRLIAATEIDGLTGLYNRDYFFQYANRMHHEHPEQPKDAFVLNIEQFHILNALNGREFGDQILRVLGNEALAVANENGGIAGRFGADRFDIYCRHTDNYQAVFDRLQNKLIGLAPNASIRIRMGVMPSQPKLEPVQQFDMARTACSMARGHYKEHLIVFDEKVRKRELMDQRLLNDLRRALDNYEFEVYYQPKYDIQADPPRLVSAEALIRWQHPELGMIAPDDFIPLFERNGKIGEVDKYVWSQAARQVARWRAQFGVTIPVSVNLSRVDVFDPALMDTLDGILRENGLDHDAFKLEVAETAYTDNSDQVIRVVERLRGKGFTVEMDDFGTGYSSLNMLSAMPVDVLKMDRTFVQNIENDQKDIQLVALILGIANNLNIPVIAEGVETEAQIRLLKELGCTLVQGYYFSKPLHPAEFETDILAKTLGDR